DGREGQRGPGLLPDGPRPDRERGDEPHRAGLPGGLHQGAADGVRHRVQPPGEARDGGVARMTVASPRPRPQRQGLTDFTLAVTRDDIAAIHAAQAGPDWLLADREAGFEAFDALPAETNDLYTTYIDLRGAHLAETALHRSPRVEPTAIELPSGSDGFLVITDGDLTGVALSREASAAGVALTTLADLLEYRPERAKELLEGARTLPGDDRFAQLTRAAWSQGVVLDVPAGVQLADPIIVRWATGAPGRAVI